MSIAINCRVDVFAQNIRKELNLYVFPTFGMVFPVLSFFKEQKIPVCTCFLPYLQAVPVWQTLVERCKISSLVFGWQEELFKSQQRKDMSLIIN